MKKLISLFIVISLLCSCGIIAHAEDPYVFEFRNGIHWGMSESELQSVVGEDLISVEGEEIVAPYKIVGQYPVSVSKYNNVYLVYIFNNDSLYHILYIFDEPAECAYLADALSLVYGESNSLQMMEKAESLLKFFKSLSFFNLVDVDEIINMTVNDLAEDADFNEMAKWYYNWILPDDTVINLLHFDGDTMIQYINDGFGGDRLITDGL